MHAVEQGRHYSAARLVAAANILDLLPDAASRFAAAYSLMLPSRKQWPKGCPGSFAKALTVIALLMRLFELANRI